MAKKAILFLLILSAVMLLPLVAAQVTVTIEPYPKYITGGNDISITITPGAEGVGPNVIIKNSTFSTALGTMCAESKCFDKKKFIFYVPSDWQGTYSVSYTEYVKEAGNVIARPSTPNDETEFVVYSSENIKYQCSFAKRYDCRRTQELSSTLSHCPTGWIETSSIRTSAFLINFPIIDMRGKILTSGLFEFLGQIAGAIGKAGDWVLSAIKLTFSYATAPIFCVLNGAVISGNYGNCVNDQWDTAKRSYDHDLDQLSKGEGPLSHMLPDLACLVPNAFGAGDECRNAAKNIGGPAAGGVSGGGVNQVIGKTASCYQDYSTDYGRECDSGDKIIKIVYWDSINSIETNQESGWTACSSSPSCGGEGNKAGTKISEETCISKNSCTQNKDCPSTEGFIATNMGCYWRTRVCQDCGSGACEYNNLCYMNGEGNDIQQICTEGSWISGGPNSTGY